MNQQPDFLELYGPFWPVMAIALLILLIGMGAFITVLTYRDQKRTRQLNRMYNPMPRPEA